MLTEKTVNPIYSGCDRSFFRRSKRVRIMEQDKPPARPMETAFARQQRENASDAERRLWSILSRKQIKGERFRRKEPIGPYLVDFYCPGAKLAIELDSSEPGADLHAVETRTRWLTEQGYRVVRLRAEDVRRAPWPIVNQLARKFRLRNLPPSKPSEWNGGPSNQS